MAKPKKKKAPTAVSQSTAADDDALLDAAIAEKEAALRKQSRFTVQEIVERMNNVPAFAIYKAVGVEKTHLPTSIADDGGTPQEVSAFFADPAEAKRALSEAQRACPDMELVLGAVQLGNAFSLAVGWVAAMCHQGSAPFTLRGSETLTKNMRPHLMAQLDKMGMPSSWQIPVIICDELTTAATKPVFLDHASFAAAWKAAGHSKPPPSSLMVTDLRIVVDMVLRCPASSSDQWKNVRFVGFQRAHDVAVAALDEFKAAGGIDIGSGKNCSDEAVKEEEKSPGTSDTVETALDPTSEAEEAD